MPPRANTHEGSNWSSGIPDPRANTASSGATEDTVYNFIQGQWNSFTQQSFKDDILNMYPLSGYGDSFDQQGAGMYGELRYICTASMIAGEVAGLGGNAYHYQ